MKAPEYDKMYRAEKRFWWFVAKGLLVEDWAGQWLDRGGEYVDVGCGTGANLERVASLGRWTGVDMSADALRFCLGRDHRLLVRARAGRLPFAGGCFYGAMALDLFEHLEDDRGAAAEIFRIIRPGGRLIVTVPAHPRLWSAHDLAMGHVRRYDKESLVRLLMGAGFSVVRLTHFLGTLFPIMLPGKIWQKWLGNPEDTMSYQWPEWANRLLLAVAGLEIGWLKKHDLPVGTTLAAVAQKPQGGGASGV